MEAIMHSPDLTPARKLGVCAEATEQSSDPAFRQDISSSCVQAIPRAELRALQVAGETSTMHTPIEFANISDATGGAAPCNIVTRKFGLRPLESGMEVDLLPVFSGFERCVNTLIRAGIQLALGKTRPEVVTELEEKENKEGEEPGEENVEASSSYETGVKSIIVNFYIPVSKIPWVKARIKNPRSPVSERFWRCASQYAYYAVEGYNFNRQLITHLVKLFQRIPSADLPTQLQVKGKAQDTGFPSDALIEEAQQIIQGIRPGSGVPSEAYTTNLLRYLRNLILRILNKGTLWTEAKLLPPSQELKNGIAAALRDTSRCTAEISANIPALLADQFEAFFKKLSSALTRRVSRYLAGKAPPWKYTTSLDRLIMRICGSIYPTSRKEWKRARDRWRKTQGAALKSQLPTLDLLNIATEVHKMVQDRLMPARALALALRFRNRLPWIEDDTLGAFQKFLVELEATKLEKAVADRIVAQLAPHFQAVLTLLAAKPEDWVKVPHFKGQAIPFAMDSIHGIIHKLQYQAALTDPTQNVILSLSFYRRPKGSMKGHRGGNLPKVWWDFKLFEEATAGKPKRASRFQDALGRDPVSGAPQFRPLTGVLLRKTGHHLQPGGGLVLALPFKAVKSPSSTPVTRNKAVRVAGVDLGLKVFATVSIAECEQVADAKTHRWKRVGNEVARYFIDQREIVGKRAEWIGKGKPTSTANSTRSVLSKKDVRGGNFKRRLTELQQLARQYQSWKDEYVRNHRDRQEQGIASAQGSVRHKVKYQKWRREWKRVWRKIQGLHQELAHQVATRVVAALEREQVRVVLLEDLRWAKQKPKEQVGYFLTTWQVHWFYARVQALLAALARWKGILVEWVNPRGTSVRCSHCGQETKTQRVGKIFRCHNTTCRQALGKKPLQLDADLNGARNIMTAPVEVNPTTL